MDHGILLDKLYADDIHNNLHAWFRTYLHRISWFILLDNNKSKNKQKIHWDYLKCKKIS